jgi:mannitol/fructose-specific phosphotransferase system IIA component (Ntr-type)
MVLSPSEHPEMHLQLLASIAQFLSDPQRRERLRGARDEAQALDILRAPRDGNDEE